MQRHQVRLLQQLLQADILHTWVQREGYAGKVCKQRVGARTPTRGSASEVASAHRRAHEAQPMRHAAQRMQARPGQLRREGSLREP